MSDIKQQLDRLFLTGSIWAFSGKVVAIAAALFVNAMLARLLGPKMFGIYILASSIVVVASILASLGLNTAVVRLLGESHTLHEGRQTRNIIKQCLLLGVCGAVVAAILISGEPGIWLARHVFKSEVLVSCLIWMGIWIVALTTQSLVAEFHRGIKDIRFAAILAGPLGGAGLVIILLATVLFDIQITVQSAIAFSACTTLIALPVGMFFLWKKVRPSTGERFRSTRKIVVLALPMLVTNFTLILLNQADIWVVGVFLAASQVALYGAALQVASLISLPLLILNSVIPPYIAEYHRLGTHPDLQASLRRATGFAAYASIFGFMICLLVSPWILEVIYGDYYRQATNIFIVIAIGRLVNVLAGPCGMVLMMTGSHIMMMWINILGACVAVLAMVLVVRVHGLLGVATVAAIVMVLQNTIMVVLARNRAGIWTYAELNPRVLLSK